MKLIPSAVARSAGRQLLVGRKHSPTILLIGGVAGVVASTVMACKATLKLEEVLSETEDAVELANHLQHDKYSEEDRKKDLAYIHIRNVVKIGKLYAPAIGLGVISVAALVGSNRILTKRNAALTAAYAAMERGFAEYRKRVVAELGKDKDEEFRYGVTTEEIVNPETGKKTKKKVLGNSDPSIYARFFDEYNRNWEKQPEYNMLFLRCQQNYANDLLRTRGHLFLNEVYTMLGMEHSSAGAVVGWVINKSDEPGDNYIDFNIFDGENERKRAFVNQDEASILLDFNVDGVIYDKI